VVVRSVDPGGLLEQEAGSAGSPGVGADVFHDGNDHAVISRSSWHSSETVADTGNDRILIDEIASPPDRGM
jgi:hypothetical protein